MTKTAHAALSAGDVQVVTRGRVSRGGGGAGAGADRRARRTLQGAGPVRAGEAHPAGGARPGPSAGRRGEPQRQRPADPRQAEGPTLQEAVTELLDRLRVRLDRTTRDWRSLRGRHRHTIRTATPAGVGPSAVIRRKYVAPEPSTPSRRSSRWSCWTTTSTCSPTRPRGATQWSGAPRRGTAWPACGPAARRRPTCRSASTRTRRPSSPSTRRSGASPPSRGPSSSTPTRSAAEGDPLPAARRRLRPYRRGLAVARGRRVRRWRRPLPGPPRSVRDSGPGRWPRRVRADPPVSAPGR